MKKYIYWILFLLVFSLAGIGLYEKSLTPKSIYVDSMTADEMSTALKNGSIQGFISWEPYPAKAIDEGYGKYLVNSKDIWMNHPSCVLTVSDDLKDEDMIRALVWAHIKGTRFINDPKNHEKVLKYGSEFSGLDANAVSAAINNTLYIEFPDINETKKGFEILDNAGAFKKSPQLLGYNDLDEFLNTLIVRKYYNDVKKGLDKSPDYMPGKVNGSLRFAYIDGNIHYLAIYVAQKEGYFEKIGLVPGENLQFLKYRSGLAITNAFEHREIDAATLGTTPTLRYRLNSNGMIRIVSAVNSGGTSLIVKADSDIDSIEDLNGAKIATPGFGSCQDVLMRKMFEGFEIKAI